MTDKKLPIVDYCRVCGLPWMMTREEGQHEICPCCGCHVGLDDIDLESVKEQREKWLSTGPTWWRKNESAPHHWNPIEQMKNIPPEWR